MLTRVKRENEKRSKTPNLCTNLIQVKEYHPLNLGYTPVFKKKNSDHFFIKKKYANFDQKIHNFDNFYSNFFW